jgi:hypothetical protein
MAKRERKHWPSAQYSTGIQAPAGLELMPIDEITERWNAASGEPPISEKRVWQILKIAEKKLHRELVGVAREMFYEKK